MELDAATIRILATIEREALADDCTVMTSADGDVGNIQQNSSAESWRDEV